MKTELLAALRNSDGYVSGQELCETLGVSRTAVWKVMQKLKAEGYEIEAVSNKGYRLISSPDVLSAEELESIRKMLQILPMCRQSGSQKKAVCMEPWSLQTDRRAEKDAGAESGILRKIRESL